MMNWDLLAETPAAGLPKAQLPTARPPKLFVAKQFEPFKDELRKGLKSKTKESARNTSELTKVELLLLDKARPQESQQVRLPR